MQTTTQQTHPGPAGATALIDELIKGLIATVGFEGHTYRVDTRKEVFVNIEDRSDWENFSSPRGRRMCDVPVRTSCPACGMPAWIPAGQIGEFTCCVRCSNLYEVDHIEPGASAE